MTSLDGLSHDFEWAYPKRSENILSFFSDRDWILPEIPELFLSGTARDSPTDQKSVSVKNSRSTWQ